MFSVPDVGMIGSLKHIAQMDLYAKTVKPLFDALTSISKALLSLKGGKDDLKLLHQGVLTGSSAANTFQAG